MKNILILLAFMSLAAFVGVGLYKSQTKAQAIDYCKNRFPHEYINFMREGELFSTNRDVTLTIIHRVDPKEIESFMYFTGEGWSKYEDDGLTVLEPDSCKLKQKYFEFINATK